MSAQMHSEDSPTLAYVLGQNGTPQGMAFCVGVRHFVTCAHVIAEALPPGHDRYGTEPPPAGSRIRLHFFETGAGPTLAAVDASVVLWSRCVMPDDPNATRNERRRADVAVLELDDAALAQIAKPQVAISPLRPARLLGREEFFPGRVFSVLGSSEGGLLSEAAIKMDMDGRWIALQVDGAAIRPGFSGGAATISSSRAKNGILGMVVRAHGKEKQSQLISSPILREVLGKEIDLLPAVPYHDRVHKLLALLQRLPADLPLLAEAFSLAVRGVDPPPEPPRGPRSMVEVLSDLPPCRDGRPPLLTFVAELVGRLPVSQIKASLRAWLTESGVDASSAVPALRSVPSRPANGVIEICQALPPGFIVRAWFCDDANRISLGGEEVDGRLALKSWVSRTVLDFAKRCQASDRELVVEILLPDEMLLSVEAQIEDYQLEPGRKDSQTLGTVYPVVFRSHWRAANEMATLYRGNWKRWSELAAFMGCMPVQWVAQEEQAERLFAQLALRIRRANDGSDLDDAPMSIALAFPPKGRNGLRILRKVIEAGAPLVLWPRHPLDERTVDALKSELEIMAKGDFPGLPHRLLQRRLEMDAADDNMMPSSVRHLSVLYDEEGRSLEELIRAAPLRGEMLVASRVSV